MTGDAEERDTEARDTKYMKRPVKPSSEEIEKHERIHLPFRSWCSKCVRAKASATSHDKIVDKDAAVERVPRISIDYMFMGRKGHPDITPY